MPYGHRFKPQILTLSVSCLIVQVALAADVYVESPVDSGASFLIDQLGLEKIDSDNQGFSLFDRRSQISFTRGVNDPYGSADAKDLSSFQGDQSHYLYKYLASDVVDTAPSTLLGTSGTERPLIIDLGESELKYTGTVEAPGTIFVTTVNSNASSDGLKMDESTTADATHFEVDSQSSGHLSVGELIEQTASTPSSFQVLLDLNSSLKNGAEFVLIEETAGSAASVIFEANESTDSNLFDTSYVIDSQAFVRKSGQNDQVVVRFSRDDDQYITKSNTDSHPSNSAALALGTIAADGVALGDMQTVLTRLDINDFGYGNNAENLATQVKRLAPIANNSLIIAAFDGMKLASDAIDYRIQSRRGRWSDYTERDSSIWVRSLYANTRSSGSLPIATDTTQDDAGHDGFRSSIKGTAIGYDAAFSHGVLGLSLADLATNLQQTDERDRERSAIDSRIWSLYGQVHGRRYFASLSLRHGDSQTTGWRRTAIDRVASYDFLSSGSELAIKAGRRFDLVDGRTALTPYLRYLETHYQQDPYQEQGAGALGLRVSEQDVSKTAIELGLNVSHKGRFGGIKSLTALNAALVRDIDISDLTVTAQYTGETDTAHPDYTTFTTPAETWAADYVALGLELQLEMGKGLLLKAGFDGEFRHSRQNYSADLSLIWAF